MGSFHCPVIVRTEPYFQQRFWSVTEIVLASPSCMVAVGMGDDCTSPPTARGQCKNLPGTVETFVGEFDEHWQWCSDYVQGNERTAWRFHVGLHICVCDCRFRQPLVKRWNARVRWEWEKHSSEDISHVAKKATSSHYSRFTTDNSLLTMLDLQQSHRPLLTLTKYRFLFSKYSSVSWLFVVEHRLNIEAGKNLIFPLRVSSEATSFFVSSNNKAKRIMDS